MTKTLYNREMGFSNKIVMDQSKCQKQIFIIIILFFYIDL